MGKSKRRSVCLAAGYGRTHQAQTKTQPGWSKGHHRRHEEALAFAEGYGWKGATRRRKECREGSRKSGEEERAGQKGSVEENCREQDGYGSYTIGGGDIRSVVNR